MWRTWWKIQRRVKRNESWSCKYTFISHIFFSFIYFKQVNVWLAEVFCLDLGKIKKFIWRESHLSSTTSAISLLKPFFRRIYTISHSKFIFDMSFLCPNFCTWLIIISKSKQKKSSWILCWSELKNTTKTPQKTWLLAISKAWFKIKNFQWCCWKLKHRYRNKIVRKMMKRPIFHQEINKVMKGPLSYRQVISKMHLRMTLSKSMSF